MSAPVTAEALSLADALATAAHRLRGPVAEACAAPALDLACEHLVDLIAEDPELLMALALVRRTRYGCPP